MTSPGNQTGDPLGLCSNHLPTPARALPLLLIMPEKLALLPDIPVPNNGIISLPVTAVAKFRVVFLSDSLSPTS